MQRIRVRHRPQDRGAIHHLGKRGQQLADAAARQARGNRAQLAANLQRSIGLGIDKLDLAGRTVQVDQDDRLGAAERFGSRRCLRRRRALASGQIGQAHAGQSQPADAEQIAARHAAAKLPSRSKDSQHRWTLQAACFPPTDRGRGDPPRRTHGSTHSEQIARAAEASTSPIC